MINSRFLDGMTIDGGEGGGRASGSKATASRQRAGRRAPGQLPPARLGHLAPALLGLPDPGHPLRACGVVPVPENDLPVMLPEDVDLRQARQPARPPSDLEARRLPAMRRRRRRARPTRWTPSSIRPGTSRASPIRGSTRADRPQRSSTAGCRSTSISAASSTRSCTCSIRASSPAP